MTVVLSYCLTSLVAKTRENSRNVKDRYLIYQPVRPVEVLTCLTPWTNTPFGETHTHKHIYEEREREYA